MEQSGKSYKIASGVAVILMVGAIVWGAWQARLNKNLEDERDREKLKVESLLSEKLLAEKNLATVESQRRDMLRAKEDLERQIQVANNRAELKDQSIAQLQRQLAAARKSYAELGASNREIEKRLALLDSEIAQLQEERLAARTEADNLRAQLDNTKRELAMAHSAYYDKALVESTRGKKDKLVVKATRTRKLKATIMIPSALKDVQFQVFDPSGKLISSSPEDGIVAVKINEEASVLASESRSGSTHTYKQANMTFIPKKKLKAGLYRVEVLSENLPVGSLQLRLR